jgi:hypothetical protein
MANIGVELKRLLTKLGGTPSKYDQTNELLHKITDQVNAGGSGGGGLVVETEWVAGSGLLDPAFKSNVLGVDLRAAITSGQNVVVHIPGKTDYGIGELYFSPMLELTDASGQADIRYRLPYDKSGSMAYSNLLDGDDDSEGYVQFRVYTD